MEGKSSIICINSNSYWGLCLGRQTLFHVMGSCMLCSQQAWGRRTWPLLRWHRDTQELNLLLSRCKGEGRIQTQPEIYNHCTCQYFNLKFHIIPPSFAEVPLTCNMWVKGTVFMVCSGRRGLELLGACNRLRRTLDWNSVCPISRVGRRKTSQGHTRGQSLDFS